jgi:hypothetical protein
LAPIFERAVAFPLVMGEGRVHVPEAPPCKLNSLQDRARPPLAVLDDPVLADNDAFVALASGPAGADFLPVSTSSSNSSASSGVSPNEKLSSSSVIDPISLK